MKRKKNKKNRKPGRKYKTKPEKCNVIQWGELYTDAAGNPVCGDCGARAEQTLGFIGQPCWAHAQIRAARGAT